MKTVQVSASRNYAIHVGADLLTASGTYIRPLTASKRIAVVTDDVVEALYLARLKASLLENGFDDVYVFVIPNGEASKNLSHVEQIYNFLAEHNITRTDLVVALGGGVVGDITGFAAATYLRGICYVQIPTTLLSQVDSSVGGKTGVNLQSGKNLAGAFWQPSLVLCDTSTLDTLPPETFADGMAEVIKYGAIRDCSLFELLCSPDYRDHIEDIIHRCVSIKRDIVQTDEFDTGERMLLNFGHTLGHAIERKSEYAVTHGSAVAIGMILITAASERAGLTASGSVSALIRACKAHALPTSTDIPVELLADICGNDKKRDGGNLNLIVLEQIGKGIIYKLPAPDLKGFVCGGCK